MSPDNLKEFDRPPEITPVDDLVRDSIRDPLRPFTVAVVEDDPLMARLVSLLLKRNGLAVIESGTGTEARQRLLTEHWDLAILDRVLPDMDGVNLCQELKMNPATTGRYILLVTGEDSHEKKVQGFAMGADDYVTKPFHPEELMARVRAGKRMVDLQNRLVVANRKLQVLSTTDTLTGISNRRLFDKVLLRSFEHAQRYQRPLSVVVIDVDGFKSINDRFGHQVGDEVLRTIASTMQASMRVTDFLCRYGGEEFAVILPETGLDDANRFADKIRQAVASRTIPPIGWSVTVSAGVATFPHTWFSKPAEVLEAADQALYRAKKRGRNRVEVENRRVNRQNGAQPGMSFASA